MDALFILLVFVFAIVWLGVALGGGGSTRAGRGRSYVDVHREPLPRTPPDAYENDGGLYR